MLEVGPGNVPKGSEGRDSGKYWHTPFIVVTVTIAK